MHAAVAPGRADNVFETAACSHGRSLVPFYDDRRSARGLGTAATPAAAPAATAPAPRPTAAATPSDGMLGLGLGVLRALRARRAPSRVRRLHLRHRHMARFVRAVRLLP
jgi:hypothetical protein